MAKRARVHNNPFGREVERLSDVRRWIKQGIVYEISGGEFAFSEAFADAVRREITTTRAAQDAGYDDGILRRWVTRVSGGIGVKQLLPVKYVGTANGTTRNPDRLTRRVTRGGIPVTRMQNIPVGA